MDERKMTPPMGPGGPPPEGGPGPGPGGPMARLGAEYSFEILAPAGVPVKQLHIDLDYAVRPFGQVEEEYLTLFRKLTGN